MSKCPRSISLKAWHRAIREENRKSIGGKLRLKVPVLAAGDYFWGREAADLSCSSADPAAAVKAKKVKKDPIGQTILMRFPRALQHLARISVVGCEKRKQPLTVTAFLDAPDAYGVYTDAMIRHVVMEAIEGPVNLDPADPGGFLHAGHAAWSAIARLEVALRDSDLLHRVD